MRRLIGPEPWRPCWTRRPASGKQVAALLRRDIGIPEGLSRSEAKRLLRADWARGGPGLAAMLRASKRARTNVHEVHDDVR